MLNMPDKAGHPPTAESLVIMVPPTPKKGTGTLASRNNIAPNPRQKTTVISIPTLFAGRKIP